MIRSRPKFDFDRDLAKNPDGMQGVLCGSFVCRSCGQIRSILGRKAIVKGSPKHGWYCASCAPADEPKPVKVVAEKVAKPKPEKAAPVNRLLTDNQVLAARAAHEFHGVPYQELAEKYGMTRDYMQRLLLYTVRSRLIPKRGVNYEENEVK